MATGMGLNMWGLSSHSGVGAAKTPFQRATRTSVRRKETTMLWELSRPRGGAEHGTALKGSLGASVPKYSGADDIYRELVEESDDNWLLGLVAFAVFEEQRIEWAKHRLETRGHAPTAAEVSAWYESQPPSALTRA